MTPLNIFFLCLIATLLVLLVSVFLCSLKDYLLILVYHHRHVADNLIEWLAIATFSLVPSAKARIWTEIKAHYEESVQLHLAHGLSESQSQATALADLGNAYAARQRFRRGYLTENEAWVIAGLIKRSSRGQIFGAIGLIFIFLLGWCGVFFGLLNVPPDTRFALINGVKTTVLGFALWYALDVPGIYFGRNGRHGLTENSLLSVNVLRLLSIHFTVNFILGAACLIFAWVLYRAEPVWIFNLVVIFAVFLFSCDKLHRLRKKLQILGNGRLNLT